MLDRLIKLAAGEHEPTSKLTESSEPCFSCEVIVPNLTICGLSGYLLKTAPDRSVKIASVLLGSGLLIYQNVFNENNNYRLKWD